MFSKVEEKAEEYWDDKTKYFPFCRNTVPQKSITKRILYNLHENFLLKKTLLRFFKNGQNELQTYNLRPNHIVANLFVTFRFAISFHTQLDNWFENEDGIIQSQICFFILLSTQHRLAFDLCHNLYMFSLTLFGADRMFGHLTNQTCTSSALNTPAVATGSLILLIFEIGADIGHVIIPRLQHWIQL